MHGSRFKDFITHEIIDRYNLLCSIVAHDKKQPDYEDEESSFGDRLIPKNSTIEVLEPLGATFILLIYRLNFWKIIMG